jgi:hypothetical protein
MRDQLALIDGERLRFKATVERFGTKPSFRGGPKPTMLVRDVKLLTTEQLVTDHLWFTVGKTIDQLYLCPGDQIEFDARVGKYLKGYVSWRDGIDERELDYKLTRPTNFKLLNRSSYA